MRPRLHFVNTVPEVALAADATVVHDLGVNSLSCVLVNIRACNETSTLSNYARYLEMVGSIDNLRINYKGASVVSMSGRDIAAMNTFRHNIQPREFNPDNTDNAKRCVVLPILLGRFFADPTSGFPRCNRGDLTIEITFDVADTGYDTFRYSIDSYEILDANPIEYERRVTIAKTFNAVGQQDTPLPVGNLLRGLLLFGTTPGTGAAPAPSWGNGMQVLLNNQQHTIANLDWEQSVVLSQLLGRSTPDNDAHQHTMEPVAGIETTQAWNRGAGGWENYSFLDFDPTRSDLFSINTAGASQVLFRTNAETADAVRLIPVERIVL